MNNDVAVIGAGPAGLMAAEVLARGGATVTIYEKMPTPGRKLLMAGRGGLNLTHSEPLPAFLARYGGTAIRPFVEAFTPADLRAWCEELGEPTFVGSSGRIFPTAMKAAPLLRAWLRRLDRLGVVLRTRHSCLGWTEDGTLLIQPPAGEPLRLSPAATVIALGGASWPRLGSDGSWAPAFAAGGIDLVPFTPANVGVRVDWSERMRAFAGTPLKRLALTCGPEMSRGEAVITQEGLEGGAVYALSRAVREATAGPGGAELRVDLRSDFTIEELAGRLAIGREARGGKASASTVLRKAAGLSPAAVALLREGALMTGRPLPFGDPAALARAIKDVRLPMSGLAGLSRAISSAGGVAFTAVDEHLMLKARPGTFIAGEMLDWEAPTGGYLLQGCFATGIAAGHAALDWLKRREP